MIVVDNVAGSQPPGLGGFRPDRHDSIGADQPCRRSGTESATRAAIASLGVNTSQYRGADVLGRALLFTPNPFQSGSSVSHWDVSAFPNQLMEPSFNADLTHEVTPPQT